MDSRTDFDIAVVGGGIVGLAAAYKIARKHPEVRIVVLEKEEELAQHQTGHNSGVIHSGLYYRPGSAKARTCTAGRRELVAFAEEYGIPFDICGKIVVATNEKEAERLDELFETGMENGVEGLEKIEADKIEEMEPACKGVAALKVPCTGIIDFVAVANKLAELFVAQGKKNRIKTCCEVTGFDRHDFFTRISTTQGTIDARYIINCAGLFSDRIAVLDQVKPEVRIVPFRGDYYDLTENAAEKVKALIYPVPDPAFPFLGVHFTRTIGGSVECGPNAVLALKREGYGKKDFSLKDAWESLCYKGTLKLFVRHCRYGVGEYVRAFSKKRFVASLQKLIPSVTEEDIKPGKTGVRAQAVGPDGSIVDDFRIVTGVRSVHVLNAPSPAATACLAIGEHINRIAEEHFKLTGKKKKKAKAKAKKTKKKKKAATGKSKSTTARKTRAKAAKD